MQTSRIFVLDYGSKFARASRIESHARNMWRNLQKKGMISCWRNCCDGDAFLCVPFISQASVASLTDSRSLFLSILILVILQTRELISTLRFNILCRGSKLMDCY